MATRTLLTLLFLLRLCSSSPIESSHLSRLLDIHERDRPLPSVQEAAARGVLGRLLPSHLSSFDFRIVSKERCGGKACFIISNHPSFTIRGTPEILVQGVSGVEISAGLHWYLKNWCAAHISWEKTGGVQLSSIPKPGFLPVVHPDGILIQRPVPWNYYQNAVTSSYSFAWWDWERWEKEIDWMALQGINLPLAFTGQEAIWQKVFQRFNISASEIADFLEGLHFLHGHVWATYMDGEDRYLKVGLMISLYFRRKFFTECMNSECLQFFLPSLETFLLH
ncbi:putative alpha-N-acetylglucosaminidase [Iris pallida]|uniref:Alpha-N-acetylglucosaminidase n=1 Tax=Iris pallida TaxID=29817 RepID=A0AAX6DMS3_IRIPA|nr:putative alpha-N-acetylglucosaminidase [Iris pallida]